MEKINKILGNEISGNESINTRLEAIDRNFDVLKPLQQTINLYVSTTGDDTTGDGSEAKPYKTIQKSLDVLPKNLGGNNATVNITSGTYDKGFNADGFYNGRLNIAGNSENIPIISSDCIIQNSLLNVISTTFIKIVGNKTDINNNGVLTIKNVIHCAIAGIEIDGVNGEDGILILDNVDCGIYNCKINNCKNVVNTSYYSGRGLATITFSGNSGINNKVKINNRYAIISANSNSISAETEHIKAGGIIIDLDGTLI